jgi:class 3 adenylate cyclase
MFLIFYIYAGIVAKIVDNCNGTSTEFLGDGVLNLFDTKDSNRDTAFRNSMLASWDIMEAREIILNPFFLSVGLPQINLGIGIDHGITIVTKFGYRNDVDLKAFGKCVYNASKLCKGVNEIIVSQNSQSEWPSGPGGNLHFGQPLYIDNKFAYPAFKNS